MNNKDLLHHGHLRDAWSIYNDWRWVGEENEVGGPHAADAPTLRLIKPRPTSSPSRLQASQPFPPFLGGNTRRKNHQPPIIEPICSQASNTICSALRYITKTPIQQFPSPYHRLSTRARDCASTVVSDLCDSLLAERVTIYKYPCVLGTLISFHSSECFR